MRLFLVTFALLSLATTTLAQTPQHARAEDEVIRPTRVETRVMLPVHPRRRRPPTVNHAWERRVSLETQTVINGPVGIGNVVLEVAPIPELVFSIGAGISVDGWRAALGVRPQIRTRARGAIGVDLGVSMGPAQDLCLYCESVPGQGFAYDRATFLNIGLSYEIRYHNGFKMRLLTGWKGIVGGECTQISCESGRYLYGGITMGWALGRGTAPESAPEQQGPRRSL